MAVRSAIPLACLASGAAGQCVESAFRLPFTIGPREVHALAGFDDGTGPALYQGGETYGGGRPALVRWNGTAWLPAGIGPGPEVVWTLRVLDEPGGPAMYVGGEFASAGGVPAMNFARRDAQGWSTLGGGVPEVVRCIHRHDFDGPGPQPTALLVGTTAGIRRWDGAQWVLIAGVSGSPQYTGVFALETFDTDGAGPGVPELYAGGSFSGIGGLTVASLARFDGAAWRQLAEGLFFAVSVNSLREFHEPGGAVSLAVAGHWAESGGVYRPGIARWDGQAWGAYGAGGLDDYAGTVWADVAVRNGSPALYIAGDEFLAVGGVPADGLARWDEHGWAWVPVWPPPDGNCVAAIDLDGPGGAEAAVFVGHQFANSPDGSTLRWGCPDARFCYPNCDGSTAAPILNVLDFNCFLNRFAAGDPYANCDNSLQPPMLNVLDFNCFLNRFVSDCR
jgi:hypothetical protein